MVMILYVPDDAAANYVAASFNNDLIRAEVDPTAPMGTVLNEAGERVFFRYGSPARRYGSISTALPAYTAAEAEADCAYEALWQMGYWNTPECNRNN